MLKKNEFFWAFAYLLIASILLLTSAFLDLGYKYQSFSFVQMLCAVGILIGLYYKKKRKIFISKKLKNLMLLIFLFVILLSSFLYYLITDINIGLITISIILSITGIIALIFIFKPKS